MTNIQKVILDHYKSFCDPEMVSKIMRNHLNNFKIFLRVVEKSLESRRPKENHE
tara:strand:- start:18 stop:179 length:162 start_codon:yes stop_codon:yes gene_type:complete